MSEFLAEASVLIQANTKLFRAELAAALATVPKAIEIPIVAVAQTGTVRSAAATLAQEASVASAATGAAAEKAAVSTAAASEVSTAALGKEVAARERAAVATQEQVAAQTQALQINRAFAATAEAVAVAELKVVGAASEVEAAEIKKARATQAGIAARELLTKAQLEGLNVEGLLRNSVVRTAVAYGEEAAAAEASAAAQAATARSTAAAAAASAVRTGEVTKGLQAQALSAVGLRGAIIGANSAFLAATAGAIIFGKAIQSAAQFQTQLAVFGATTGATASQLDDVAAAAKQLGSDLTLPGVNAQDAAVAMTELAKAGLSVQESIDGARGILQLATAAGIDNAQATELAASALNAFGLAGSDAAHVADVFANAANDAQGSITDVGIANAQASAAARQAGLSLEQTAGILTIFARNGIKGSDAGTSLRTLLIRLINPTEKANAVIEKLGLHLRDATGGINLGFFDEFQRKTANLTAAERDRDAAIIAGQDAFRGLTILSREGGVELTNQIDRLNKFGTASDIAAARTSGLAGSAENLKNQLSTAALAIGESLAPALTDLANAASKAVGSVTTLLTQVGKLREESTKPIDFIINTISGSKGGGDSGGFTGGVKKFVDDFVSTLPGQVAGAADSFAHLQQIVRESNAEFEKIRAQNALPGIIEDLNKVKANPRAFDETIRKLQELEKNMAGGAPETEAFRKSFEAFIESLQNQSAKGITLPIKLPQSVLDGTFGADAGSNVGFNVATNAKDAFIRGMQSDDTFTGGFIGLQIAKAFGPAAAAARAGAQSAVDAAKKVFADASTTLTLNLSLAQASGNQSKELSLLQTREANQEAFLAAVLKRSKTKKNVDLAIQAAKNLEATRAQIKQIQDQAISDQNTAANEAKQRATDAQTARDKADQAVLDSFLPSEQRLDVREAAAQKTGAPQALIAVEKARKRQLLSEIAQIQDNFNNTKNAASLIAAKRVQIVNLDAQITSNIQAIFTQGQQDRADALQSQVNVAQAEGNIPLQIRLNNVLIAAINKKIASDKLVGKALNDAKAQRATLQAANQGLRDQNIQNQIALGQSVADLTGNKDQLIAALDAAIAADRARVAALKKAGKSSTVVQTELNGFLQQRKEALKKATDDAKEVQGRGTTAFDLLKQANDTFNQNAGNLINPSQPFAGPTGFTADIAQFLIRRQQPTTSTASTAKADFTAPLVASNAELITVIKDNTDALRGKTDKSGPVSSGRTTQHPRVWAADSFWARRFQEA